MLMFTLIIKIHFIKILIYKKKTLKKLLKKYKITKS
jgi:hypothetical protein